MTRAWTRVDALMFAPRSHVGQAASRSCRPRDPNYAGACVPPYPPDVDCDDVGTSVTIVGSDPHGLDGNDNDGLGCESY